MSHMSQIINLKEPLLYRYFKLSRPVLSDDTKVFHPHTSLNLRVNSCLHKLVMLHWFGSLLLLYFSYQSTKCLYPDVMMIY